jgi:hypothetical protein
MVRTAPITGRLLLIWSLTRKNRVLLFPGLALSPLGEARRKPNTEQSNLELIFTGVTDSTTRFRGIIVPSGFGLFKPRYHITSKSSIR